MTPAVGTERPDAAGQADQRRMPAGDVADPDLGLRHVEQRIPVRAPELDERDDEREREHGQQRGEEERSDPAGPAIGRCRAVGLVR